MSQADPEELVLDFNINVETADLSSEEIRQGVREFADSQTEIGQIADRVESFLSVRSAQ